VPEIIAETACWPSARRGRPRWSTASWSPSSQSWSSPASLCSAATSARCSTTSLGWS